MCCYWQGGRRLSYLGDRDSNLFLKVLAFGWGGGEDSINRIIEKENQFLSLRTNLIRLLPFPKDL